MRKFDLIYGSYSGLTVSFLMLLSMAFADGGFLMSQIAGYSMMAIALVFLIVGMKLYRDAQASGTFRYIEGLLVGAGIAAVASIYYTVSWEIYLYFTDYSFMPQYIENQLASAREAGQTQLQLERLEMQLSQQAEWYKSFTFRAGITFMEMFPVGALVSLVASLILRNPNVLPRKTSSSD